MTRSDLHVPSEEKVYETVIAWIREDPATRKAHFPVLLGKVRLLQIGTPYLLEKVKKDPFVAVSFSMVFVGLVAGGRVV